MLLNEDRDFIASAVKSMIYARKNHNRGEIAGKIMQKNNINTHPRSFSSSIRKLNLFLKSV